MTCSHPENDHPEHTFAALAKSDAQLEHFVNSPYTKLASHKLIAADKGGLEKNGFKVHVGQGPRRGIRDSQEPDPCRCKRQ